MQDMSSYEIIRAIDSIRDTFDSWVTEYDMEMSPSFHFTGGEPFLRKDLFAILDYVRKCGFSTSLMSNGTLIDDDMARRIREAGVSDVQISLDGLETTHEDLRGKGSFQRTLEGIRNLVSQGVEANINLTVSRINMGQTGELVRLAEELGVSAIAFSRLVPTGRGKGLSSETLTREEVAHFYGELQGFKDNSKVVVTSRDPLSAIADMDGEIPQTEMPISGCAAGIFGVTITADGTIMPCRRMDLPVGNIKETSFRELWVESPVLGSLRRREDYHGGCESCRYWAVCRGCRAIALAHARANGHEDYLGPDPQCPYHCLS
jgi:radical SAM protein with 4Fe4S-binding SPASM domain